MLKILRKNLKLTIEGEIEVKEKSIKDYEAYVEEEIKKQKKEEILSYLKNAFPNNSMLTPYYNMGYSAALEDIAEFLTNQECEDES